MEKIFFLFFSSNGGTLTKKKANIYFSKNDKSYTKGKPLHSAADFQKTGKDSYFFAFAYFNKPNSI
jgi:hypothetical protein